MASSWLPRLTVVLVGFMGGALAFSATHDQPNRQSCAAWKEIAAAIVEDAEQLGHGDATAEGTLSSAAFELSHNAEDYPERHYRTHTPSVEASDELLDAAQKLARSSYRADGLGLLKESVVHFAEVCR